MPDDGTGQVIHEVIDRFTPVRTAEDIRAVLVAGGALPSPDEQLAKLETWLTKVIARVEDPDERWLLRTYVNWQPLCRLHRLPAGKQVTHGQANGFRIEVRYVVRLLEWLRQSGSSLAQCTLDHVDTWLSDGPALRSCVRAFLLWTSRRGHTRQPAAPMNNGDFTVHVIAQDQHGDGRALALPGELADQVVQRGGQFGGFLAEPQRDLVPVVGDVLGREQGDAAGGLGEQQ
ncbi:hypothetical protein H8N00_16240 [Streptomyces sp. AC563]|uniref:hypothetical protein n=1 Tax=Streptomyces buecherae TaxID=2763006 RepID=UPI00164D9DF0|nr:hypothetical protein [Streptomyces buecherae]MBC3990398.1 hypothetical protein [Streptomyces buecherae]